MKLTDQQKLFGLMLLIVGGLWFLLHRSGAMADGAPVGQSDLVGGSAGVPATPPPPAPPCNPHMITPAAMSV